MKHPARSEYSCSVLVMSCMVSATPWSVGVPWRIVRAMPASRSRTHVAILFSEHAAPERYVISKLADYWRQDGLLVDYLFETTRFVPADVLMLHVDLSVLPRRILSFASRYPRVINQHVSDIRKRTFSTLIVPRPSEHAGPVIECTDYTYDSRGRLARRTSWSQWRE